MHPHGFLVQLLELGIYSVRCVPYVSWVFTQSAYSFRFRVHLWGCLNYLQGTIRYTQCHLQKKDQHMIFLVTVKKVTTTGNFTYILSHAFLASTLTH